MELVIKKCRMCGEMVKVLKDEGCNIVCCGKPMETIVPNSVDAAFEKHVPNYEVKDGELKKISNGSDDYYKLLDTLKDYLEDLLSIHWII